MKWQNPHLLYGVAAASATTAWAVGDRGAILATTNGGTTWTAQTSGTTEWLYGVAAASATTAWAVEGSGAILATCNGGGAPTPSATTTPRTAQPWRVFIPFALRNYAGC